MVTGWSRSMGYRKLRQGSKISFWSNHRTGLIKSATDFQVYKEVAGLSGLDFAYADIGAVYHTKAAKTRGGHRVERAEYWHTQIRLVGFRVELELKVELHFALKLGSFLITYSSSSTRFTKRARVALELKTRSS
ncbi:hypothetical protein IFM89_019887 [Coptis chinensis]|uniref:Uncharacterized protein n=1 Tax=Coptis chinensis TaxID=261450 RepID=A0A835HDZ5_9MAGN|nr:hypothetical protein IFM89_019887 [Coptis chinensis]